MKKITKIYDLHNIVKIFRAKNQKIGFIPTMGCLHYGHIQLIELSKKYSDIIIVSIFINPFQFNNFIDFKNYPKKPDEDYNVLKKYNVDILFQPSINEMYCKTIKQHTFVEVPTLSNIVEGKSRPKHFRGVTTIITKLFNLIQPNFAFFGEKDYQQLLIIKNLVSELNYSIKIISLPIIRANNGLALSSRNALLGPEELKKAPYLYKILQKTAKKIQKEKCYLQKKIINKSKQLLLKKGFSIDIFDIYDCNSLNSASKNSKQIIILASVWIKDVRLIDNYKIFFNNSA